jgi:hypothetical protein
MKLTLELPDIIRVIATSDYKGNPLTAVLIGDAEVLYAAGHEPGGLAPEHWEDIFRTHLSRILADLLLPAVNHRHADEPLWTSESPTGRETWGKDASAYEVHLTQETGQ